MARIAGIKKIRNPRTGRLEKIVIDIKKALKNKDVSRWVEDFLDYMDILHSRKHGKFIPWEEVRKKINKKFGFKD